MKTFFSEVYNKYLFCWHHLIFYFPKRIQNIELLEDVLNSILNELGKVLQSMLQSTSNSHWRKEESLDLKDNLVNVKVMIQENKNVFKRVCSVLKSIQILKDNISVFKFFQNI